MNAHGKLMSDAWLTPRQMIGRARSELPTPALVLDVDRMRENIATMASSTAGRASVRPHFKVHKCLEIAREQVAAGAIGMTAATVWEAATLVRGGFPHGRGGHTDRAGGHLFARDLEALVHLSLIHI